MRSRDSESSRGGDLLGLLFKGKLIEGYEIVDRSPCLADPERFKVIAKVGRELGDVLPVLFLSVPNARYSESSGTASYSFERHNVVVGHNGELAVTFIKDDEELGQLMGRIIGLLNRCLTYAASGKRAPRSLVEEKKKLSPMTIYGMLPQTNCRECGESGCYAFASRLFNGEKEMADCPYTDAELRKTLQPIAL
jgi:ArsR family metal-binding transcriptional regulator